MSLIPCNTNCSYGPVKDNTNNKFQNKKPWPTGQGFLGFTLISDHHSENAVRISGRAG